MPEDELQPLRQAVQGLLYPSESDEPFEVVQIPPRAGMATVVAVVKQLAGKRKAAELKPEDFFSALTGSDDADRFNALQKLLRTMLTDPHVFRVGDGETRVDVYLLGKTRSGAIAGLHTVSVET